MVDENQGCRQITLSAPNYRAEGSHLKFEVKAKARIGTALGNTCLAPVEWEGYVVFEQRPRIETQSWQLYFETLDSTLYDHNHRPAQVAGIIWELINTPVHEYLSAVRIDLAPPASELKAFLRSLFRPRLENRAEQKSIPKCSPKWSSPRPGRKAVCGSFWLKRKKIVYLRSYNGSSVGVMQINERVWRGIYDVDRLRWNIRYNSRAGCEILDLYVTKYIEKNLKEMNSGGKISDDTLAKVIYAMYDGGPQDFKKFLSRKKLGKYFKSDKLFLERYNWVKTGHWQNIQKCLGNL